MLELKKHNDTWGEWFELCRVETIKGNLEVNLGFKVIDDQLMEVEGSFVFYQSEYEVDDVPWTKVVSVDTLEIKTLITATFGLKFDHLPIIDSCTNEGFNRIKKLKKEAGYHLTEFGEFVPDVQFSVSNNKKVKLKI